MLLSPFLSSSQAEVTMKQNHHVYKTSMMNKNERDRLWFECQFLFRYCATNEGQFLAHLDVGTPYGCKLHYMEQHCVTYAAEVMHIGLKYQHCPSNSDQQRYIDEKIAEQSRSIVGRYHDAIKEYLRVRVRFSRLACSMESNNKENQRKSNNLNHYPRIRNEAQSSNKTKW